MVIRNWRVVFVMEDDEDGSIHRVEVNAPTCEEAWERLSPATRQMTLIGMLVSKEAIHAVG